MLSVADSKVPRLEITAPLSRCVRDTLPALTKGLVVIRLIVSAISDLLAYLQVCRHAVSRVGEKR